VTATLALSDGGVLSTSSALAAQSGRASDTDQKDGACRKRQVRVLLGVLRNPCDDAAGFFCGSD